MLDRTSAPVRDPVYTAESLASFDVEPSNVDLVFSTRDTSWSSLLVDELQGNGTCGVYERVVTKDVRLTVGLAGAWDISANHSGRWSTGIAHVGAIGVNDALQPMRLHWRNRHHSKPFRLAAVYLPARFLAEAADHLRQPGQKLDTAIGSSVVLNDRAVGGTLAALVGAAKQAASDLYAEQAARWLATHLVHSHQRRYNPAEDQRQPGTITDARLSRVVDYMHANIGQPITLTDMAREAAVSTFHFSRLFHRSVGLTPQRYLTEQRLVSAASMLHTTDLPVAEIAATCGYSRAGAFSTAFMRRFSVTPSEYRDKAAS
jgi:AraC family transcriptional regulator